MPMKPLSVTIPTDGYAYPIDATTRPMIALYNAPYKEGDCPLWSELLSRDDEIKTWHSLDGSASIDSISVIIDSTDTNQIVQGYPYEVRIYRTDSPVGCDESTYGTFRWSGTDTAREPYK